MSRGKEEEGSPTKHQEQIDYPTPLLSSLTPVLPPLHFPLNFSSNGTGKPKGQENQLVASAIKEVGRQMGSGVQVGFETAAFCLPIMQLAQPQFGWTNRNWLRYTLNTSIQYRVKRPSHELGNSGFSATILE